MQLGKTVVCRGLFGEAVEVPVDDLRFRPGAYGILLRDNSILLSKQWDGWDFPGGGINLGEKIEDAVVREFKEETGLTVKPEKLLSVQDHFFQPKFSPEQHWQTIMIYFTCSYISGELSTEGFDEHEKEYAGMAEWIPLDTIDSLKFYNPVDSPALIRMAAEGKGI